MENIFNTNFQPDYELERNSSDNLFLSDDVIKKRLKGQHLKKIKKKKLKKIKKESKKNNRNKKS